jgi:hypothetical protein
MKAYEAYNHMMVSKDIMNGISEMRNNLHNGIELANMVLEYGKGRVPGPVLRQAELVVKGAKYDGWPEASRLGQFNGKDHETHERSGG